MPAPIDNPLVRIKSCEVIIERRYKGGNRHTLLARMVEWIEGTEGKEPVFGMCLLSPNQVTDVQMAKRICHRYLDSVYDEVKFTLRV